MHIPWEDLELLLAVLEEGSFSAAARRLRLTQPTISRRIALVEERVGHSLFRRDVEGAHLTAASARLLPAVQQMARWATESGRIADGFDERPMGDVRIAAPPGTAHELLVPLAERLRRKLPDVALHLITGVQQLDLSRGQADLAVRSIAPTRPDLEVVARRRVQMGVFVSKAHARRLGSARSMVPAELDWIAWAYPNEHVEPNPTLARLIPGFRPAFASNDYVVQLRALARGLGAMVLTKTHHAGQSHPRLVEIQVGLPLPPVDFYVVCAKTSRWVPRIRAVVEELTGLLDEVEGVEKVL
jgi:DNA-binding transcriptional LysR family regulator